MPKNKTILILVLILLVGLFLRVRLAQDKYLHEWDERFHALVAKNILKHPLKPTLYDNPVLDYNYKEWYSNHVWLHKPPLPLWVIGISYKLFGLSEFSTRIPSLLLSLLAIYLTFLLGKYLFNEKVGLLAAFFFAINGLLIEISTGRVTTDHYDTFFLVFIEASVLLAYLNATKRKIIYALLTGVCIGLALLTKWLPALIVLPIHFFFLLHEKHSLLNIIKNLGTTLFIAALIAVPWQIHIFNSFTLEAKWESYYNWLHFTQELEGHTDDDGFLFYFHKLRINYSEIIYLPLIFFIYKLKSNMSNYKYWSLLVWVFIPILIFSFAKMKLQGYILFTAPALFLITSYFFFELKDKYLNETTRKSLRTLYYLVLTAIILLPIRYCYERTAFGLKEPREDLQTNSYKNIEMQTKEHSVIFNVQRPVEFMFYHNAVAYTSIPSNEQIDQIYAKGYLVYICDDGNLSQYILANNKINKLKF